MRNGSYSGVNEKFAPLPFYRDAFLKCLVRRTADLLPQLCIIEALKYTKYFGGSKL